MDLDAFVDRHQGEWVRLEQLLRQRHLSGAESDELLDSYQRVATHLSVIRSSAPDPSLVAHLSSLLARARARSAGTRSVSWAGFAGFFTRTFPAALYRTRRWWIITGLVNVAVAFLVGAWLVDNPIVENTLLSPEEIQQLVGSDFENYYSEHAASSFATRVWVNNVWVSAFCIALGVLGFPVIFLLWTNIFNVAVIGSLMHTHDRAELFYGLLLPHGILELTAVFVAAGTGLRLFWSWVAPGARTRIASMAAEGRSAAGVAMGLIVVLLLSGVIEAFVTPSGLPTWARLAIGVLAELAFLTYVFTLGRWAHQQGETGDIDARDSGDYAPVAG